MANATDLTRPVETYPFAPVSDDPDVIRQQIEHTRSRMETTINAIGDRLSPENLIEQAKTSAREATKERINDMKHEANRKVEGVTNTFGRTVRDNPLPVALIGVGLGWLWLSSRDKGTPYPPSRFVYRSEGYGDYDEGNGRHLDAAREWVDEAATVAERQAGQMRYRVGETAQTIGETVNDVAHRTGETVSEHIDKAAETFGEAAETIQARAGETAEAIQERVSQTALRTQQEADRLRREAEWRSRVALDRTRQSFWETLNENPLVVGAVATMVGAAIGASIPTTDYENQLLGETRDRLLDEAKTRAQDAVGRVQAVVEDTQRAAVSEAKEAAHRHHLTVEEVVAGQNGDTDIA